MLDIAADLIRLILDFFRISESADEVSKSENGCSRNLYTKLVLIIP